MENQRMQFNAKPYIQTTVRFQPLFWLLSIPVFYIIITLTTSLNVPSRLVTVPYRVLLAIFGIYGIYRIMRRGISFGWPMKILLAFSLVFMLRICYDGINHRLDDMGGFIEVFAGFFLCAFIPGFYGYYTRSPSIKTLNWLWLGLFICCLFMILKYRGLSVDPAGLRSTSAIGEEGILNPIKVGHLGALLVEVSLYILIHSKAKWKHLSVCGFSGILLVTMSNSRSPLLALSLVSTIILLSSLLSKKITGIQKTLLTFIGMIFIVAVIIYINMYGGYIFERFTDEGTVDEYRQYLYQECVNAALTNPIFGKGVLVLHPAGFYGGSESFILDGFHSTGLLFGFAWVFVIIYAVVKGAFLFIKNPDFWFYIVFLHGVLLFGTCGSLINCIWGFVALMTALGSIEELKRYNRNLSGQPVVQ